MNIIAIEFEDVDGIFKVDREYVSTDAEVEDVLRSYIDAGCRILRWTWWQ